MEPLSIEELKNLSEGDWVWILPIDKALCGYYAEILRQEKEALIYAAICRGVQTIYSDYGKTWLAYKNKEQAECKGEIVELPIPIIRPWNSTKGSGFSISFPRIVEDVEYYKTELEAERRLKELKRE